MTQRVGSMKDVLQAENGATASKEQQVPKAGPSNFAAVAWSAANLSSSIAVVIVNKIVFRKYLFLFPMTLCTLHTVTTVLGLRVCASNPSILTPKPIPTYNRWLMGSVYAAFVVSGILSIQLNPVGFYQITRNCTTPAVVLFELVLYKKVPSRKVVASIVVLLLGVTFCSVLDLEVKATSTLGVVVAVIATIVSAYHTVLAGAQQKELQVTGMQLLYECTPPAATIMAVLIPLIDPTGFVGEISSRTLIGYQWTLNAALIVGFSSMLGFSVMLSAFQMIHVTSPLTYNVIGYSKTIFVVLGGWALFNDHMSLGKAAGVSLAISGVAGYTLAKMQEGQQAQQAQLLTVQEGQQQQKGYKGQHQAQQQKREQEIQPHSEEADAQMHVPLLAEHKQTA